MKITAYVTLWVSAGATAHSVPTSEPKQSNASIITSPFNYLANLSDYAAPTFPQDFATDGPPLELVHELYGNFPTGIAVDKTNRIFFCIPRSITNTAHTVSLATNFTAEEAWPNQAIQNCAPGQNVSTCFVNVQSVVIDSTQERIWILDAGVLPLAKIALEYGTKVWAFNLTTGESIRNYVLPRKLTSSGMNINDIRFNLSLSTQGIGYLSDEQGSLLTLDLDSGIYSRHLFNETVTSADPGFVANFNGEPWYQWNGTMRSHVAIGADGIALASGNLYFSPLASRRLYQIPQTTLVNTSLNTADLLATVEYIGEVGSNTEGFTADAEGRVYMGTAEQNSITYFNTSLSTLTNSTTLNGLTTGMKGTIPSSSISIQPFVRSAVIQWPDSMCVENDFLWFTTNQLALMPQYQRNNVDKRVKPFKVYRAYVGTGPAV